MGNQADPNSINRVTSGISGQAAGCVFVLHADGALSLSRPASIDQEAFAIELSAAELIALHVFFDAVDLDRLLRRLAAPQPMS